MLPYSDAPVGGYAVNRFDGKTIDTYDTYGEAFAMARRMMTWLDTAYYVVVPSPTQEAPQ